MGALDMGLTEEELPPLVAAWRKEGDWMMPVPLFILRR